MKDDPNYLRVGQVATLLGVSPATCWRWLQERPDFPKPHKPHPRTTVWDREELIAWRRSREKNLDALLGDLPVSRKPSDGGPHTALCCALLAGASREYIARWMGEPVSSIGQWLRGDLPEAHISEAARLAITQILSREEELREKLAKNPLLSGDKQFQRDLDNLDHAHKLAFGRSLTEYLLAQEQERGHDAT